MLIDTHCHLQDAIFSEDLDEILKRAKNAGVKKIICVGTNLEDSKKAILLAQKYEEVYATVGIFPQEKIPEGDFRIELSELASNKKVVAIGECGVDYVLGMKNDTETQKELFRKQIGTAVQLDLPIVIHNRNGDNDIIEELSHYKDTGKLRGVFHCFTSSDKEFIKKVLDLGFYISFTAIITYPSAKDLEDAVKFIPKDKILVETDAPYLSPQKFRGERNEPEYVRITADKIAQILNITLEELAEITTKNAQKLFNL